jgi:predicted ester cyclase
MSTPKLVEDFYERIWNDGNLNAAAELLTPEFSFRGSLGNEMRGREAFQNYVRTVRAALADYQCEILSCVTEANQAFAKMRFSGCHVAEFRGYEPTGKRVLWLGAALFRFEDSMIAELWVLGDLAGLDSLLRRQAAESKET